MRGSFAVPISGRSTSALVVQDGLSAAFERVESVDTHVHLRTRHGQRLLEFRVLHAEGLARQLEYAQSFDEANRATTFTDEQRRTDVVRRVAEVVFCGGCVSLFVV